MQQRILCEAKNMASDRLGVVLCFSSLIKMKLTTLVRVGTNGRHNHGCGASPLANEISQLSILLKPGFATVCQYRVRVKAVLNPSFRKYSSYQSPVKGLRQKLNRILKQIGGCTSNKYEAVTHYGN